MSFPSLPRDARWVACLAAGLLVGLGLPENGPLGNGGLALRAQETAPAEKDGDPADGEPGPNVDGYKPYVDLLKAEYVRAAGGSDRGLVRFTFHLSTDIPKGTKVSFMLEYQGLDFEETEYALQTENRRNLTLDFKPEKRLATGDYFVRTRIYPKKQSTAVQRMLRQNEKALPEKFEPWPYLYMREGKPEWTITVGGEAERRAEQEEICKIYTALMDQLVMNMNEFVDKMDEVGEGKDLVSGGRIDTEKFTKYVVDWRKKQGETQQSILQLQLKNPALFLKTQTAYAYLVRLGTMVSKRAWQKQNEITEQYKVPAVNPPSHEYFDRNFRYKVDLDKLQDQYDRILELVCPVEEESAPPPPAEE